MVSDTRLAALKASISDWVPKAFATKIWRSNPIMLLRINASITTLAALAICWLAVAGGEVTRFDYI